MLTQEMEIDIPMTTKFAEFFMFDFSYSSRTLRFLLFTRGASSILIPSTPSATPLVSSLALGSLAWVCFLAPAYISRRMENSAWYYARIAPFDCAFRTTSSGLGPAKGSALAYSGKDVYGNGNKESAGPLRSCPPDPNIVLAKVDGDPLTSSSLMRLAW